MKKIVKLLSVIILTLLIGIGTYYGYKNYEEQNRKDAKFDELMEFYYPYVERLAKDLEKFASMQLSVLQYKINDVPIPFNLPYYNEPGTFTLAERKDLKNDILRLKALTIVDNGTSYLYHYSDNRKDFINAFQTIAWSSNHTEDLWYLDIECEERSFEDFENEYKDIILENNKSLITLDKYRRPNKTINYENFDSQVKSIINRD